MNILVVGGTYFLGKAFTMAAMEKNNLWLLNRGNRPLDFVKPPTVVEYHSDRHDISRIKQMEHDEFDVVVDFCAYQKDDIASMVEALEGRISQYIFVSTCDVYRRDTGVYMDENSELETRNFGGEAGAYISGKVALEEELRRCCMEHGISYTSVRPAFIYGPGNYAPRESIFFNWIKNAGQILYPVDADGSFQMVYVKDVADIILTLCGNEKAYNRAFNLCGEMLDYGKFAEILRQATGVEFEKLELTVEEIQNKNIPLPFPLKKQETQWYNGESIKELGVVYTPIEVGMREAYNEYK